MKTLNRKKIEDPTEYIEYQIKLLCSLKKHGHNAAEYIEKKGNEKFAEHHRPLKK